MSNHFDIDALTIAYEFGIGKVLDASRLVSRFDGTDRDSLDELRSALNELDQIITRIGELYRGH
jgi:hypothetical protein